MPGWALPKLRFYRSRVGQLGLHPSKALTAKEIDFNPFSSFDRTAPSSFDRTTTCQSLHPRFSRSGVSNSSPFPGFAYRIPKGGPTVVLRRSNGAIPCLQRSNTAASPNIQAARRATGGSGSRQAPLSAGWHVPRAQGRGFISLGRARRLGFLRCAAAVQHVYATAIEPRSWSPRAGA
jgi:hypothetical protein